MGILSHPRHSLVVMAAKRPFILSPHAALTSQINKAAQQIQDAFAGNEYLLDKGNSISDSVYGDDIAKAIKPVISQARMLGFQHGAAITKKSVPAMYPKQVMERAAKRAAWVSNKMNKTSRKVLKNTPDSDYVLDKERAFMASQYEASRAYFRGVKDAVRGSGWGKAWITTEGESCDDCLANEDQGPIDVDDIFDSGDDFPPAHQNCPCPIEIVKMQ